MKDIKKGNKSASFSSKLPEDAFKRESNPIDEVMKKILEKDSKSCNLASARLSQIKESAKGSFGTADESLTRDSKERI